MKIKLAGAVADGVALVASRAIEIRAAYEAFIVAGKSATQQAYRLGELLVGVKDTLPHGEWLPWLEKNVDFTDQTARNFMGFYRQVGSNSKVLLDLPADAYSKYLPQQAPRVTPRNPLPIPAPDVEVDGDDVVDPEVVERERKRKPPTFEHMLEFWQIQQGGAEDSVEDTLAVGRAWTPEQRKKIWTRAIKPMIRELNKLSSWGE